jgi:hypothetical protein
MSFPSCVHFTHFMQIMHKYIIVFFMYHNVQYSITRFYMNFLIQYDSSIPTSWKIKPNHIHQTKNSFATLEPLNELPPPPPVTTTITLHPLNNMENKSSFIHCQGISKISSSHINNNHTYKVKTWIRLICISTIMCYASPAHI